MKWFFLDARQRLRRLAATPVYAAKVVFREIAVANERFLSHITGESVSQVWQYLDEPPRTHEFSHHIGECEKACRTMRISDTHCFVPCVSCNSNLYDRHWVLRGPDQP